MLDPRPGRPWHAVMFSLMAVHDLSPLDAHLLSYANGSGIQTTVRLSSNTGPAIRLSAVDA
jgi:hypothetical protein